MLRLRQPSSWILSGQSTTESPSPGTGVLNSRLAALLPALSCSLVIMQSLSCQRYGLREAECRDTRVQGIRGRGVCSREHWRPDQQPPTQHALCQRPSRAAFCECSLSLRLRSVCPWPSGRNCQKRLEA